MKNFREPVVSGQFYPSDKSALQATIAKLVGKGKFEKVECIGVISPHAGYPYSGAVAAAVFANIKINDTVVLLGPNHTGGGKPFSIELSGTWRLPLGDVEIDEEVAGSILKKSLFLKEDKFAGLYEHSLEVQIPIIQYFRKDFKIVPIVISHGAYDTLKSIGTQLADALKDLKRKILIVASSDMTHYEPEEAASKKDKMAIDKILKMDALGLYETAEKFGISMCGLAPVVTMLNAAKELGAASSKLIEYRTSGDVTGDYSSVVGYAGIIIK